MNDTHNPQPDSVENTGGARSASHHRPESPAPQAEGQQAANYNVLAIIAFAGAFFNSIVAIVCGHIALSQIAKTGEQGRGLALAGTIIGYVGLGISVVAFVAFLALLPVFIKTAMQNCTFDSGYFSYNDPQNSQWIPAT